MFTCPVFGLSTSICKSIFFSRWVQRCLWGEAGMKMLDDESHTSANLGNDHGFINKNTFFFSLVRGLLGNPKAKQWELILKVDNIIPLWRVVFVYRDVHWPDGDENEDLFPTAYNSLFIFTWDFGKKKKTNKQTAD